MATDVGLAVSALLRERARLTGEIQGIDRALTALGHSPDMAVPASAVVDQVVNDPAPVPARKVTDTPPPRRGQRPRRPFTASAKRAGADLGREIGIDAAAEQIGVDRDQIEAWMRWFPSEGTASEEPKREPAHDGKPPQALAVVPPAAPAPSGEFVCSCGWHGDSDGWRKHNERLQMHELRDHKLVRRAS